MISLNSLNLSQFIELSFSHSDVQDLHILRFSSEWSAAQDWDNWVDHLQLVIELSDDSNLIVLLWLITTVQCRVKHLSIESLSCSYYVTCRTLAFTYYLIL